MQVTYPAVPTFSNVKADRAQALKILEEAGEVFSAMETYEAVKESESTSIVEVQRAREALIDEMADVVQAVSNLASALGIQSMNDPMKMCYTRNKLRGRL